MRIELLALAAISLLGGAAAQCGANALTTPPNFAFNGGGAVGGVMYFTLDVTAVNGVRICQLDLNTSAAGAIHGLVYLHQSVTTWNQLTGANNGPGDWCAIACFSGAASPAGTPSAMTISNATASIDLPMGQYLIGIGNGNFNHRYTNGNGTNQTVADANLTFDSGRAANLIYTGSLFSPRVWNGTLHYDVGAAPVSLSSCGAVCGAATCAEVGTGCGGGPGLHLACTSRPLLGSPFVVTLSGVPAGGVGAVLAEHAPLGSGVALSSPPFAANCIRYISANHASLGLQFTASFAWTVHIPAGTAFLGVPYGLQGVAMDLAPFSLSTSNGIDAVVGNY